MNPPNPELPDNDKPVIVLCENYRCLGFLDADGVWRETKNNAAIKGVIGWNEIGV